MNALGRLRYMAVALLTKAIEVAVLAKIRVMGGSPGTLDRWLLDATHRMMLRQIDRMRADVPESVAVADATAGIHNSQVALSPSNPGWGQAAIDETTTIRLALGDDCVAVHHIGSTAVAELEAKPILDLAAELSAPAFEQRIGAAIAALQGIGYRYVGVRGGLFFEKGPTPVRTHALQVHPAGSVVLLMLLLFRDLLREDSALRDEYAATKAVIAFHLPDQRWIYSLYKGHWIQERQWRHGAANSWVDWFVAQGIPQARFAKVKDLPG